MEEEAQKLCYKCKKWKGLSEFYRDKHSQYGRQGMCKACEKERHKKYYPANRDRFLEYAKKHQRAKKDFINQLKDKPCADCGKTYPPICMEFDHIGTDKRKDIAYLLNHGYPMEKIIEEVKKCELVCSNCHRIRTWKRMLKK